jgi:uncharacterized OsmC-like protein
VEYVLNALAFFLTTPLVLPSSARVIQLDRVESRLEGDLDVQGFLGLDENVRNGYQQIRVSFTVEGDITEEQREELLSFTRMSPVFDVVTNGVPVNVQVEAK